MFEVKLLFIGNMISFCKFKNSTKYVQCEIEFRIEISRVNLMRTPLGNITAPKYINENHLATKTD